MHQSDLEGIASINTDPCLLVDALGRIIYANAVFHDTFGYADVALTPLTDLMPARFIDDHNHGFRRAMDAGYTRYRNGFSATLAILDARGKERPVTLPLLNVMRMDGVPVAMASIRLVPRRNWWAFAAVIIAAAVIAMAATMAVNIGHIRDNDAELAQNKAELMDNASRLNRQLVIIRGGILQLKTDLPDIAGGKITPEDLQDRLDLIYQQLDELIVNNEQIKNQLEQGISEARDGS